MLLRHGIPGRIRKINSCSARINYRFKDLAYKIKITPGGVFSGKFDI